MEKKHAGRTSGLILGKFLPPHLGHQYLADFARGWVDEVTILVGTLRAEPIPGQLRHEWMREMCPWANVLHLTDENPQEPHEHPDFWQIWHDSIRRLVPTGPDCVFASEPYGAKLAEILGAEFIPVDIPRDVVPVSGTSVRERPLANWRFIPPPVRPYFVKRVCIMGAESTGKSILARGLAANFGTAHVSEYARGYLAFKNNQCSAGDFQCIAKGQLASEDALARQAEKVLICDTDTLTTAIWHEILVGPDSGWLYDLAETRSYDLYILPANDTPWVDDPQRFLPQGRDWFLSRCQEELDKRSRPYVTISGSWEKRFAQAVAAVETILKD